MSTYVVLVVAFALAVVLFRWEARDRRPDVPRYVWFEQEPDEDEDAGPYEVGDPDWAMVCEWVDWVDAWPCLDREPA